MREILFRGKRVDNGEWIFGNVFGHITTQNGRQRPITEKTKRGFRFYTDIYSVKIRKETIGQYTGLTDKNGKKIFEGDILGGLIDYNAKRYINAVVEFSDGSFGVRDNRCGCNRFTAFTGFCNMKWEKIGNIYDNPEMLED